MTYNPGDYWEKRLSQKFSLSRVGNISFSERYNAWCYKAKARRLKEALISNSIEVKGRTVCDIGCGTGFYTNFYLQRGAKNIVGVDITGVSIENLKKKHPNHSFVQGNIALPSILEQINLRFDIINIIDVLYHVTEDSAFNQALLNIFALTKLNGYIIFTDTWNQRNVRCAEHVRTRSKEAYEAIFKEKGIEILAVYPVFNLLNWPLFGRIPIPHFNLIDNFFAPVYYYMDKVWLPSKRSNLTMIVARKTAH